MPQLTVGLTGGVASGKSLVGDLFAALGVPVLDADQVSRDLVQPPSPALEQIRSTFGEGFLLPDGNLDRARMRQHVFNNDDARRQLESILHPLMAQRIQRWRDGCEAAYCIVSAAILVESGLHRLVQRILVVDVPVAYQTQRLLARDSISEDLATRMLAAQMDRNQRLQWATDVIDNSGSPARTRERVLQLHQTYLEAAATLGKAPQT